MFLCDIGNSRFHFYHKGKVWHESVEKTPEIKLPNFKNKIYALSVNDKGFQKLQKEYEVVLINNLVDFDTNYIGLGIDRAVACKAIEDGVVVDAGSAITVDVIQNGIHLGGYILPGLNKYERIYSNISEKLAKSINLAVDLDTLPQNTGDGISYGIIASLVEIIKKTAKTKKLFFTGGDGAYLAKFFDNSIVDNLLVFKGMEKVIKESL